MLDAKGILLRMRQWHNWGREGAIAPACSRWVGYRTVVTKIFYV